jgi:GNAT superfamily N-acetyltransferase
MKCCHRVQRATADSTLFPMRTHLGQQNNRSSHPTTPREPTSEFSRQPTRHAATRNPLPSFVERCNQGRWAHGRTFSGRPRNPPPDGHIGCGALKFHQRRPAELKRMWIVPAARGLGVGRRLLVELERTAREAGAVVLRLETNRALSEAIALYKRSGYVEVKPFNNEPYAHHWFEKTLGKKTQSGRVQ